MTDAANDDLRAEQEREAAEVKALHREVKALARRLGESEEPQAIGKAGDLLLAVARQVSDNAGLTKRHAVKVEAKVKPVKSIDEWLTEGEDRGA